MARFLLLMAVMESGLINLFAQGVADAKASATGKQSTSPGKGANSFFAMLARISGSSAGKTETNAGESGTNALSGLDDLFPALLASDIEGLLQKLEAMMAGTGATDKDLGQSLGAGGAGADSANAAGQTRDEQVESLMLGLLALFVSKEEVAGAGDGKGASATDGQKALMAALESLGISVDDKGKTDEVSGDDLPVSAGSSEGASPTDDRSTLEMLALVIFSSLQTLIERQNQEGQLGNAPGQALPFDDTVVGGVGTSSGQESTQGAIPFIAPVAPSVDTQGVAEASRDRAAERKEDLERFLMGIAEAGKETSQSVSDGGSTPQAEIKLTPSAKDGSPGNKSELVMTIRGPFRHEEQDGAQGQAATNGVANLGAQATGKGEETDTSAVTVIKDLSSLLAGNDDDASGGNAGGKEGSTGRESYQFASASDTSHAAGPEQKAAASATHTPTAAVEKFERIMEQFSSRASQHDLTVRLDIGNKESLVLGLKDLGQTVTVEVKASHQAIANLLQSQKDVIMKHLESRDVHANIFVDPDASATPDKREQRDNRQRSFLKASKEDDDFGEYLGIFA